MPKGILCTNNKKKMQKKGNTFTKIKLNKKSPFVLEEQCEHLSSKSYTVKPHFGVLRMRSDRYIKKSKYLHFSLILFCTHSPNNHYDWVMINFSVRISTIVIINLCFACVELMNIREC